MLMVWFPQHGFVWILIEQVFSHLPSLEEPVTESAELVNDLFAMSRHESAHGVNCSWEVPNIEKLNKMDID